MENPGTARDLYYSASWQVLEERVAGAAQVQYVWSAVYVDALVERDRDPTGGGTLSERFYVQQDADWNVTALVSTTGTVLERYVYDPYGGVSVLTSAWGTLMASAYAWRYGFQGGRFDWITGLSYFRNRDLSPTLGRWMQTDPTGFGAGDSNFYRLEENDPAVGSDFDGLKLKITNPAEGTRAEVEANLKKLCPDGGITVDGSGNVTMTKPDAFMNKDCPTKTACECLRGQAAGGARPER